MPGATATIHLHDSFGLGSLSQQITVGIFSDDILLNIFRHYLVATPQLWSILAHVCQGWRHVILTSPLGLRLRLYCTYGTPVLKNLNCWPALPMVVQYGGSSYLDPPAPEDDDNIVAALKQSARVSTINLTITRSLLEKLYAISEPFSQLEELALLSQDDMHLTLPTTFRWGPLLRALHWTRIAFSSFPHLILPSQDLVDLQLHEIPSIGYFSPEQFADAVSGMTHLRILSLHFLSYPPRRNFVRLPPQTGERPVLPSLTCLKYRGTSKYLDSFVARIDAPHLGDIDITFFFQPTMDASQLGRFVERIEMQTTLSQAEVQTSAHAICISFTNSSTPARLRLQISCKQLDWQLSCMAQVCDHFSPILFRVENLRINSTQSASDQDDEGGEQWLDLVRSFDGTRDIWVADNLRTDILRTLGRADGGHTIVLPYLGQLRLENLIAMNEPALDALLIFINSRSLSGRPVQVNVPLSQCHICLASFKDQKGLRYHLEDKHAYQIAVCSYCGDFEWTPGHNDLFREHLESEHGEVTAHDPLISKPLLARFLPLHLDSHLKQHSSLRAPDIVIPSPLVTAPHSQSSRNPTPEP
jgi:hypothetical protein